MFWLIFNHLQIVKYVVDSNIINMEWRRVWRSAWWVIISENQIFWTVSVFSFNDARLHE